MPIATTPLEQFNLAKQWLEDALRAHRKANTILSDYQANPAIEWERLTFHYLDNNNPHGLSKADFGLDLLQNLPMASAEVAKAGVSSNYYMNPQVTEKTIQHKLKGQGPTGFKKVVQATTTTVNGVVLEIDPTEGSLFESNISSDDTVVDFKMPPPGTISEVTLVLHNPYGRTASVKDVDLATLGMDISTVGTYVIRALLGVSAKPIILR